MNQTKREVIPFKREGFITSIAYDGDRGCYGVATSDGNLHFYVKTKVRLEPFKCIDSIEAQVHFAKNNPQKDDGRKKKKKTLELPCTQSKIWFMPRQNLWLTAGRDFQPRHWPLNKGGGILQTLRIHTDEITDCVEIHTPQCIATCSLDRTIVLFDIEHREHLRTINQGHEKGIRHLRYQAFNGTQMISIGSEIYANVWAPESLVSDVHIGTLKGHKKGIVDGQYLKMAPYFVTIDEINQANFWDI